MSKYRYLLRDYHAIKEADIALDGITVLSGINGCGKSTLSRWLYYIICGTVDFESNLFNSYIDKLASLTHRMQFACRDLAFLTNRESNEYERFNPIISDLDKIKSLTYIPTEKRIDFAKELSLKAMLITKEMLTRNISKGINNVRKNRILAFLNISSTDDDRQAIKEFKTKTERYINQRTENLHKEIRQRSKDTFFKLIRENYNIAEELPAQIQLIEDDVNIIESDHISTLFNLRSAIYVDTPMSVSMNDTENFFWDSLHDMLTDKKSNDLPTEAKKLLLRIKNLLGGKAILSEDDIIEDKSLRYVSSDKKINIDLSEVATGFKTFSYLQLLLENGYLNDETLLMIDEPEAHLHPQWIVEFARLLVLMNKNLGLKVMLASHNPDMVAAIHEIAGKEGILNNTNFYVAQPLSPDSHQFVYKGLKHEIGEIFASFNLAIDKINLYGRPAGL